MKALAEKFGENEEVWEVAGLLHDADYEITKDDPTKHTKLAIDWVKEAGGSQEIIDAILAHGWGYVEGNPKPKTRMQWSLYCCDELTGLIVATALVHPDPPSQKASEGQAKSKLNAITADSVMKKWKQKSFAAGVDRKQIEMCERELNIPLEEFVDISLGAMQEISNDLGL